MAVTKGTLTMSDGREIQITVTAGDKIRARRDAESGASDDELMLRAVHYVALREHVTEDTHFQRWADTVLDFDPVISKRAIDELEALGDITPDAAHRMRVVYGYASEEPDTEPGEASATPTSSPASPSEPGSL